MSAIIAVFLILAGGYLLGAVHVRGLSLGTSGVLLAALAAGHFGIEIPGIIREFGLACFVASVGLLSGPEFFRHFRRSALGYLTAGAAIVFTGAGVCAAAIALGIPKGLALGLLTGALTSTPGLAAATEVSGEALAAAGYGIAYPFGVLGVVLFVQLIPRLFPVNGNHKPPDDPIVRGSRSAAVQVDPHGIFPLAAAVLLGILIGQLDIPLPGGLSISFGVSGGPLLSGLLLGHFGHAGPVSLVPPRPTLELLRELGLALFLLGAGTQAGHGFLEVLHQQGISLFLWGAATTLLPMILGFVLCRRLLRLDTLSVLSTICGGMTSTPALGALLSIAGEDDVTTAYTAAYPVALVCVVVSVQLLAGFF